MKGITQLAARGYTLLTTVGNSLQSPFLLAVRLYWGWQFMMTGWGKLHNIQHVIGFFTSLNIPAPALNAWFVSGLEFVGGIESFDMRPFQFEHVGRERVTITGEFTMIGQPLRQARS